MARQTKARSGFTLIELLVVVAIIALLISILLPSLQRAREQARVAVCMANMRTISQASNSYLLEQIDLPWTLGWKYFAEGNNYKMTCISEFIWGGTMPGMTPGDYARASNDPNGKIGKITNCDLIQVPPRHRPLNAYMASSVSWDRNKEERLKRPADVPGFFKCPSDNNIAVPYANSGNKDTEDNTAWSTWQFWGTSYAINWYWPYYYQQTGLYSKQPYRSSFDTILGTDHPGSGEAVVPGLGADMIRRASGRTASELIIFYENRLNYAMEGAEPRGKQSKEQDQKNLRGWHKQADYHTAALRDGSARYQRFDTRYVNGTGWTTWPSKPWEGNLAQYNDK